MKLRDKKTKLYRANDKSMHGIKRLPFPLILSIAIILATSLIYFSVATTDGGADNSGGFSFRRAKTHQSNNGKVADKNSKSKKSTSEVTSADNSSTSSDQANSDTKNESATNKKASSDKKKTSKDSENKGKTWVPPVYKYVNHPAETRTVTVYSCKGGTYSSMEDLRDAQQKYIRRNHLPGCDGTFSNIRETTRTEVVKEAWTEKVLVKEGYWK